MTTQTDLQKKLEDALVPTLKEMQQAPDLLALAIRFQAVQDVLPLLNEILSQIISDVSSNTAGINSNIADLGIVANEIEALQDAVIELDADIFSLNSDIVDLQSDFSALESALTVLQQEEAARVGTIIWTTGDSAPTGYLFGDGAEISRATYSRLWAWVQTSGNLAATEGGKTVGQYGPGDGSTTFSLPDFGDNFIRNAGSLTVGANQGDAIRNFSLSGTITNLESESGDTVGGSGVFSASNSGSGPSDGGTSGTKRNITLSYSASSQVPTASENRPVNIAYKGLIKY